MAVTTGFYSARNFRSASVSAPISPRLPLSGISRPASVAATPGATSQRLPPRCMSILSSAGPQQFQQASTAVAPTTKQDSSQDEMLEFSVVVSRLPGKSLGLGLQDSGLNQKKLVVDGIHDGPFSAWNIANPRQKMCPGDGIVSVNGCVDFSSMLAQLHTSQVLRLVVRPVLLPKTLDLWMKAAEDFELNEDFDIGFRLQEGDLGFSQIMKIMKAESADKKTIQALGDKILLSQMLQNLKVPQMPLLFWVRKEVDLLTVSQFTEGLSAADQEGEEDAYEIVCKPTHLSNASGALIFSKTKWQEKGFNATKLLEHMQKYLAIQADASESEALKSLIPGFDIQSKYQSMIEFPAPLEIRVVTLFGKARLGIWWWGRPQAAKRNPGLKAQRTAWIVRTSEVDELDNSVDAWELLHEHSGSNKGFEKALEIFKLSMPAMAQAAEAIAKAVGAPFLRSDFFVGSEKWGVRLNEVAYGSGVECRTKASSNPNGWSDDGPAIARILQEGFARCTKKKPADAFLEPLGVLGETYEALKVEELGEEPSRNLSRPRLPAAALIAFDDAAQLKFSPIAKDQCETSKDRVALRKRLGSASCPNGAAGGRSAEAMTVIKACPAPAAPMTFAGGSLLPMPPGPMVPRAMEANAKSATSVAFGGVRTYSAARARNQYMYR